MLNDALTQETPFLCDEVNDPRCKNNLWRQKPRQGRRMQQRLRSYVSLSQTLLYEDRVYPRSESQLHQFAASGGQ